MQGKYRMCKEHVIAVASCFENILLLNGAVLGFFHIYEAFQLACSQCFNKTWYYAEVNKACSNNNILEIH